MNLKYYLDKLRNGKYNSIQYQRFEDATNWRDAERNLDKVLYGQESLKSFCKYIKNQKYSNSEEIYNVIKPLDIIAQRKAKIEKLYFKN